MATEALLEVNDLSVHFALAARGFPPKRPVVRAVDGVSLRVSSGETLGLVGESGSGKSTTARGILQLVRPHAGSVRFEGVEVTSAGRDGLKVLRRRAQMVFQDPYQSLNARMSVGDIVREPLEIHRIGDGPSRAGRVLELMDQVGLPADAVRRYPHQFSGGQQQRIGIARALAVRPSLVICDEPVAALDVSVQAQILRLLADLQGRLGVSYLFIAHDLNVVRHISQRAAVMYLGRIVEEGPSDRLFTAPRHPYTQALLSAIPIPDPDLERDRRRIVLTGEIPSPTDPPSGCRFRTRCPYAQELCARVDPPLEPIGNGESVACHFWRQIAASAGGAHRPIAVAPPPTRGLKSDVKRGPRGRAAPRHP